MRADQLLVQRGLASSRAQAQRLIAAGARWRVGAGVWQALGKNGAELPPEAEVELTDAAEARYVSRAGVKLEGALRDSQLDVRGLHCLDVGQSTGGFTDCLLAHGAAHVVGIDVGHDQLHPRLRADARVQYLERLNARSPDAIETIAAAAVTTGVAARFDLAVVDVSFISQTLVLPTVWALLRPGGMLLSLVKPQFELQPSDIGKGGVVRDASAYVRVEQRLRDGASALGFTVLDWYPSLLPGTDGNREFFLYAQRPSLT